MEEIANLKFERTIGSGTFGKVRRTLHIPSGRAVAVKILNKTKIANKKDALRIQKQITILKRVDHPNLLKLLQLVTTPKSFMLVTQLVEGEELFHRINRKGQLSEQESGQLFVQLLDGVIHLRSRGIAHRDIKPQNIIVEGSKLTLIDFGLGSLYKQGEKLQTSCGSHCYAAPEMMNSKNYDPEKSQIWALGVTLYAMLSGKLPFEHDNPIQLLKMMCENTYEQIPQISSALKELLRGMIEAKPSKRLSLEQIKSHIWIKAMQHTFNEESGIKKWNEPLLKEMMKTHSVNRDQLIWRIQESFGEESISYYLRKDEKQTNVPFHSGPVHLKYVFRSLQRAKECQTSLSQKCQVKQIKGGFFYVMIQKY